MGHCLRFWAIVLGLILFLGFGCAPRQIQPPSTPEERFARLQARADNAWSEARYALSETLYLQILEKDNLDRETRMTAWERATASAVKSGDLQKARIHLLTWAGEVEGAIRSWGWQRLNAMSFGDQDRMRIKLLALMHNPDYPWSVRQEAAWFLAAHNLKQGRPSRAWPVLETVHSLADTDDQRFELEDRLLSVINSFEPSDWDLVEPSLVDKNPGQYPYALLKWELARKRFRSGQTTWLSTWQQLTGILGSARLTDLERLRSELAFLEETYGRPFFGVALLLPLSGGYQDIGWKVVRGAEVAQYQLSRLGLNVQIKTINTASDGWLEQLRELPSRFSVVGGPLRSQVWNAVVQNDLISERTFFAFRSTLAPAEEGIDGYRFFPSPQDQVRPLIQAVFDELDIKRFGILYPKGRFGRRMARAFWQETVTRQGQLTGLAGYDKASPSDWKQDVADFLQVPEEFFQDQEEEELQESNATAITREDPDFGAVFIPDSFHHAQILVPEFFFFDEDRLVFLGPALWSQQAKKVSKLDRQFYQLALMPGAWWDGNPDPAMDNLRDLLRATVQGEPDFWVGLGFDFLRFAHRVFSRNANQDLNQQLAGLSDFSWSMAPLHWDQFGQAFQDLYLFELQGETMVKADLGAMARLLEERRELHEKRKEQAAKNRRDPGESQAEAEAEPVADSPQ